MTTVIFKGGGPGERGQRGILIVQNGRKRWEYKVEGGRGGNDVAGGDCRVSLGAPCNGGLVVDIFRVCSRCKKRLHYTHPGIHTCSVTT